MAFTDYETEQLRKALLKETRRCAVTLGMKKTSVDQLTKAVGIAKGSFYKFYESKEMLFFAVLENIHSELYGVADRALRESDGLPPSERAATANFRQAAQYMGLAICSLIMRIALWVSSILWGIIREIVNGVFRVAIGVIVAILSTIAYFGFILWLFTL